MDIREVAMRFAAEPRVVAVALAGSRGAGRDDGASDFDLYVYANGEVPLPFRRSLAGAPGAEIDNRFWETGDEWISPDGARVDAMYRSPAWIEDQLARVLVRHEASIGYSTCFWYNVLNAEPLFDPRGWYADLQARARAAGYPEELRSAIFAKNFPLLRKNQSSYRYQIALAVKRGDAVSVHHRVSALLASYFDLWFARQRLPHPGEKRLLSWLPAEEAQRVRAVLDGGPGLVAAVDALVDSVEAWGVLNRPSPVVEHAAAWVEDLERARMFYERWFGAVANDRYRSARREFSSYFLRLGGGARLELMQAPGEAARPAHLSIAVGSRGAVDDLVAAMRAEGVRVSGEPRVTGDGYYEAVVLDSEGNEVEITE